MAFTTGDIHQALHLLNFMIKIRPEERPDTTRVKRHIFFKAIWNPFSADQCKSLQPSNPFEKDKRVDTRSGSNFSCSEVELLNNYLEPSDEGMYKCMLCMFYIFYYAPYA